MFSFLVKNSLINNSQFEFQKSISTCDALINYIDYLNINYKLFISTISIDLKKAFDTVNHDILLNKLYICSLAGWVRDPRSKYNLLTMLSIVLFLRSYLFYDYIGIVFITHVHTHLYYSPSRSDTHHFTITLLNIYHHTIKYKSFLNHTIT